MSILAWLSHAQVGFTRGGGSEGEEPAPRLSQPLDLTLTQGTGTTSVFPLKGAQSGMREDRGGLKKEKFSSPGVPFWVQSRGRRRRVGVLRAER
ncbi:hypothetical protein PBY51_024900 [Eleginops maclovinus]|uniref:Uncharacterized protein n=1 Tax=Eleginops maclovinus TaxID=56733 RepID=A0AAN7XZJ5_ELEMC|nr:hypothetical protein PBY51_024900 [Eleginops maclovinus]